jgi:hypothetical protein
LSGDGVSSCGDGLRGGGVCSGGVGLSGSGGGTLARYVRRVCVSFGRERSVVWLFLDFFFLSDFQLSQNSKRFANPGSGNSVVQRERRRGSSFTCSVEARETIEKLLDGS